MKKVIMFGNCQMAEIAHVYLCYDSPYEVAAFCVDKDYLQSDNFRGLPVLPFEDITTTHPPSEYSMFVPIGAKKLNKLRAEKYYQAKEKGYELISYISSKATICPETEIGENCFIFENNVVQPFTRIGNDVILWSGNHIGHHSFIMDHCFLSSHVVISGRVTVEPYSYFGVNSTVRDDIIIKKECVIGAGALILRNTKEKEVFVQPPTKKYPFSSDSANVY